jgi:hypothetical protein
MITRDFLETWFATQPPCVLRSGYEVLSLTASDEFHHEVLSWSASVWGRYAYLREITPLLRRGRAFFGSLSGCQAGWAPVLWVHENWSVTEAIDIDWPGLLRYLSGEDDSLAELFPIHFFDPRLDDVSWGRHL